MKYNEIAKRFEEITKKYKDARNQLPKFFAYSRKQYDEGLEEFARTHQVGHIVHVCCGMFMNSSDADLFMDLINKENLELKAWAAESLENLEFIIMYEMDDHELIEAFDERDVTDALVLYKDIPGFNEAYMRTREKYFKKFEYSA